METTQPKSTSSKRQWIVASFKAATAMLKNVGYEIAEKTFKGMMVGGEFAEDFAKFGGGILGVLAGAGAKMVAAPGDWQTPLGAAVGGLVCGYSIPMVCGMAGGAAVGAVIGAGLGVCRGYDEAKEIWKANRPAEKKEMEFAPPTFPDRPFRDHECLRPQMRRMPGPP